MSPALCGSAQTSLPSFTCQPSRTPSFLKLCQPVKSEPLNNNCQPAAFSESLSAFALSSAELEAVAGVDESPPPFEEMPNFLARPAFHSSFNSVMVLPVVSFQNWSV